MYWQNSKFRSDYTDVIQDAIRNSRMYSKFSASEIEKCIFNAFKHDSLEYFQQIYNLKIYINQHQNYEHLTQDVINNPTEALIQLNGNVTNFVAEREQRFAMKQLAEQKIKEQKLAIEKKKLEDKIKEQKRLKELEDKSCSDICFKEFKKVSKMLQLIPSSDADCKMCMNRFFTIVPANAVFYPCGHNFVCFKCANSYWNNGKACGCKGCLINSKVVCPICRVAIKDVIKSYSPL